MANSMATALEAAFKDSDEEDELTAQVHETFAELASADNGSGNSSLTESFATRDSLQRHPYEGVVGAEPGSVILIKINFGQSDRHCSGTNKRPAIVLGPRRDFANGRPDEFIEALDLIFTSMNVKPHENNWDIILDNEQREKLYLSGKKEGPAQIKTTAVYTLPNRGIKYGGPIAHSKPVGKIDERLMAAIYHNRLYHLLCCPDKCDWFRRTKIKRKSVREGLVIPESMGQHIQGFKKLPEAGVNLRQNRSWGGEQVTQEDMYRLAEWTVQRKESGQLLINDIGLWIAEEWTGFESFRRRVEAADAYRLQEMRQAQLTKQ